MTYVKENQRGAYFRLGAYSVGSWREIFWGDDLAWKKSQSEGVVVLWLLVLERYFKEGCFSRGNKRENQRKTRLLEEPFERDSELSIYLRRSSELQPKTPNWGRDFQVWLLWFSCMFSFFIPFLSHSFLFFIFVCCVVLVWWFLV